MKKLLNILLLVFFVGVIGMIVFKEINRKDVTSNYLIGNPTIESIKIDRRINGKIMPAEEIKVKSKINGIVEKVFVEVGQVVEEGQKIAEIRNLTEPMDVESLKSAVSLFEIQKNTAKINYERERSLCEAGLSSKAEFESVDAKYKETIEQFESARKKLLMATKGVITSDKELSNIIYASASGTILTLFAKPGSPVIKQNNFNEGTTIAVIANMNSLKFFGEIQERDLNKIYKEQELFIETVFTEGVKIKGKIDKIYPKGIDKNGIVKFPVEAAIINCDQKLYGGINAVAIITIAEKDSVLCLEEKYISYEEDSAFVYVHDVENKYIKKAMIAGISDGVKTEILEGLELGNQVKIPDTDLK